MHMLIIKAKFHRTLNVVEDQKGSEYRDVISCQSCQNAMLTYNTQNNLILYICPGCMDWTGPPTMNQDNTYARLYLVN